jgi:N-acyl homoserine lactone hydrolase
MTDLTKYIRRLDLGYIVRPAEEAGTEHPRVEPVLAYVLRRDDATILLDTGIAMTNPESEEHYRPVRRPLAAALADLGLDLPDISIVVNCHLHFDHCGGNALLAGTPTFVQATELAAARGVGYTIPEAVDFPGVSYQELDGEAEILPGVWVIPTPGHTDGHQSLVVRQDDGTVVLAGQAHDFASDYASGVHALRAIRDGLEPPLPAYRPWLERLAEFDPRRVLFAHDCSVWEPA